MTTSLQGTPRSLGAIIATNITRRMDALGSGLALLAEATGIPTDRLLSFTADAGDMLLSELWAVANALGVRPSELLRAPGKEARRKQTVSTAGCVVPSCAARGVVRLRGIGMRHLVRGTASMRTRCGRHVRGRSTISV